MTTRTASHLQLLPRVPAVRTPVRPPEVRTGAVRTVVVTGVLGVVLAVLAGQPWDLPGRRGGAVVDVPQSLLTFVVLCAALCLWAAGRVTRPREFLPPAEAAVWWAVATTSAAVSALGVLSMASYAGAGQAAGGLLVRWAVPVVPALLGAVLARSAGRGARIRAALGTGAVTLPMVALGWALLAAPATTAAGLPDALAMTLLTGVSPFALAVAFVAAVRRA